MASSTGATVGPEVAATGEKFGVTGEASAGGALASSTGATVGPEVDVLSSVAEGEAGILAAIGEASAVPPAEHSLQSGPGISYEQYPMSV